VEQTDDCEEDYLKNLLIRITLMVTLLFAVAGFAGIHNQTVFGEGWLAGWTNRVAVTIDHTKINSTLNNFPVLINLGTSTGINKADTSYVLTSTGSNSKKIAVTTSDGTTQCFVEVAKWDVTNNDGRLWVLVPEVSNLTDTVLYLYYDNNQADNTAYVGDTGSIPGQQVWSNGFVAVYHFGQQGIGTPGEIIDSTSHQNNGFGGITTGAQPPTLQVTDTKTGYAQYFGGIPDKRYIEIPDSPDFSCPGIGPALSFSVWISPGAQNFPGLSNGDFARWMGKGNEGQAEYLWVFYNYDTDITGGSADPRPGYRADWISSTPVLPRGESQQGREAPLLRLSVIPCRLMNGCL
jgi:hypothetical protein